MHCDVSNLRLHCIKSSVDKELKTSFPTNSYHNVLKSYKMCFIQFQVYQPYCQLSLDSTVPFKTVQVNIVLLMSLRSRSCFRKRQLYRDSRDTRDSRNQLMFQKMRKKTKCLNWNIRIDINIMKKYTTLSVMYIYLYIQKHTHK